MIIWANMSKTLCYRSRNFSKLFYCTYFRPPGPIDVETTVQLASFLQTTVLQQLKINLIDNKALKVLIESLPKTLVRLDLGSNNINEDNIPTLRSYLKSNGSTLKELILPGSIAKEYLQEQESSSSLSTLKIIDDSAWQARLLCNEEPSRIDSRNMSDNDWFQFCKELTKDDTPYHQIHLLLNQDFVQNQLDYVRPLLGDQSSLTRLILDGYFSDASIPLHLVEQLKYNNSIIDLELNFQMDANVFNELVNVLTNKTNFIRLILTSCSNIGDKEVTMLIGSLKNCTVLQSLTLNQSLIEDTDFQLLLSSLPISLNQLVMNSNKISEKSLPPLLTFLKDRPTLKHISLQENIIRLNNSTNVNVFDIMEEIEKIANANHCFIHLGVNNKVKLAMAKSTDDHVSFDYVRLQDDDIYGLFHELKKHPNRNWSLDFTYKYQLSSVGYGYLSDILSSTINIIELSVGETNMDEEARTSLLNNLPKNKTLKKFDLQKNKLNNEDIQSIGDFIHNNLLLKEIDLHECEIDADGAMHLAKVLPKSRLEILNLDYNLLGDRGCTSLFSSLPPTLLSFSVAGNQIAEASLQTILTFLATNQTLKTLTIRNNPIFEEEIYWEQVTQAAHTINICELN